MTAPARTARLDILVEGYARSPHVAGTVSLVRDADRVVIVDPGMVADRDLILRPLSELGVRPDDVPELAAMVEGNLQNDPGPSGPSNLVSLYEASL
jgi:hypothetical protein